MRKLILLIILSILFFQENFAQQVPVFSQYILNEFLVNPAVAGIDGMTSINTTGRKQWLGLKNTPETYALTYSTRILKSPFSVRNRRYRRGSKGRVGLGGAFVSDWNGAINRTSLQFTYAYHIFIQNYQLSFGLSASATQFRIDQDLITLRDPNNDPITNALGKSTYIPDAGAGISFSTHEGIIGISVVNLFQSPIKFGNQEIKSQDLDHIRQYNLYGLYKFKFRNRRWDFEPSVLIRGNEKLRFTADITGRLIYLKEYWAGLSFRTTGDFILLLGMKINRFYVGYSFDYGLNELSKVSYGSHEVVLAIKLGDSIRRYRWLERY